MVTWKLRRSLTKQGENILGKGKSLCTGDGWCATVKLEKHDEKVGKETRDGIWR